MGKDPLAVELGRRGGSVKVPKGTAVLSKEEMAERSRKMNEARWGKKAGKKAVKKAGKSGGKK